MLQAEKITHVFDDILIADDLSFTFEPGKIYGIVGLKEIQIISLIKVFAAIEKPEQGEIFINEYNIFSQENNDNTDLRRKLGYVFSSGGLLSNLTIKENLLLPLDFFFPETEAEEKIKKIKYWLDFFNLDEAILDSRPARISMRSAKLILFIRTYVISPEIIIYEEPFANLNFRDRELIKNRILDLKKQGVIQILKSNSNNFILLNSDCILILDDGKILETGSWEELKKSGNSKTRKILDYYS